MRLIKTTY